MKNIGSLSRKAFGALSLALSTLATSPAQENLELGKMWTFENPPLDYLDAEYGFKPNAEWLDALRLASIRFGNGCSSSFVSPKGLIMTNHHCVRDQIAEVQGENDWVKNGFYAASAEDEVKIPGLTVQQLVSMSDVTDAVNAGIDPQADDAAAIAKKRAANSQRLVDEAKQSGDKLAPQVVALYQGAAFHLYVYQVYDDIRLVCSPHLQVAHFGGDPDNFTYPRYSLDFAFCRAYDGDEPVDTSDHYFRWSKRGVRKGELVFVTGNPGTTKRLLTEAQMEYYRDVYHPIVNELIDQRLHVRKELLGRKPQLEKELRTEILSWENTQKAYTGYYRGLLDDSLMEQKSAAEAAFRSRVKQDPELSQQFGSVWKRLEEVATRRKKLEAPLRFQTTGGHPVLAVATRIVRALDGDEEARETAVRIATTLQEDIDELTQLDFIDHLERAQRWLPEDDPWRKAVLGDRSPGQVVEQLNNSLLRDPKVVKALLEGETKPGPKFPELDMVKAFVPMMERNRQEHRELTALEDEQGALVGQALFGAYGTSVSPDATLTLRFSDGVVSDYPCNGTLAPYKTTFFGLYGRNADFDGEYPFDLPDIWIERRDKLDLSTPVDLVSSNDIIGGNSGSPLVNADLEVVGLVFDGNIEMLPNRYVYRGDVPRSVSVHVDGILQALDKIYEAKRVVDELMAGADRQR